MAQYESYQSNAAEAPLMRRWVLRALILSLFLHGALLITFNFKKLENFGSTEVPAPPPMPINMKRPVIPMVEEKEPALVASKTPKAAAIEIPSDKPELTEVRVAPQLTDLTKPLGTEKPKVDLKGLGALAKVERDTRGQMDRELNSLAGSLIKESVRSPRQPVIKLPGGKPGDGGTGGAEGIPGLQSISDMLGKTGSLKSGARGGIPGGALYEHGKAELKAEAITQLRNLGELIKRNPGATFIIEGHTDSTGTAEGNQILSEERAQSVKDWLVENMGIAAERIETIGMGSSKMIVDPKAYDEKSVSAFDLEVARQQPNRRVEIVIKTNRK